MAYKRLIGPALWCIDTYYDTPSSGSNSDGNAYIVANNPRFNLPAGMKEVYVLALIGSHVKANQYPVAYSGNNSGMCWSVPGWPDGTSDARIKTSSDPNSAVINLGAITNTSPCVVYEHFKSDASTGIIEVSIPSKSVSGKYSGAVLGGDDISQIAIPGDQSGDQYSKIYWMIISNSEISTAERVEIVTPTITNTGWTAASDGATYTTATDGATLTMSIAADDPSGKTFKCMQGFALNAAGSSVISKLSIGDKQFTLAGDGSEKLMGDCVASKSITFTAND